jgi:4-hydroxyacetophenone monooxygenase
MTTPLEPAELSITESDEAIAEALEHASIPTLLVCMAQISGDRSILEGPIKPGPVVMNEVQGMISDEDKAAVRVRALEILKAYRDSGCQLPPPPSPETIHEMMSFIVGEPVPAEYVAMMLEELALDGRDARDVAWHEDVPDQAKQRFPVLVIGAGMSGLLQAIRLEEAGIPYLVIEKNDGIGGTWFENTYPGCRVDIANHFYCYSFEPYHDWPEHFSQHKELREYFERCADKYGVREHIRFETEVVSACFDEESSTWEVRVRSCDGAEETLSARALISAVGQLNRPKIPPLPGLHCFDGFRFHSAQWDHEVPLAGKRVAVIGTGASALQLVPEVAKVASQLTVFQRSPAWMFPNPRYHDRVSDGMKWLLKHLPYYARWYRFLIFWPGSDGLLPSLVVDPEWPHPKRSINAANDAVRQVFTNWITSQVGDDPELLEKVLPKYPPFVKRMLQDNGSWLTALKRDNVELVGEGIRRITPGGVVTMDGSERAFDVLIFATGFHANKWLWPMDIIGRGGVKLGELWGEDPRSYLGIVVPGFPNLFCLYGPGTNLAHAGSIIFHSECQVRYIMCCIEAMIEKGIASMDCKEEVNEAFNRKLDETHAKMVWAHPGESSWYRNSKGRVTTTSPWRLLDYWEWTKQPKLEDYRLT